MNSQKKWVKVIINNKTLCYLDGDFIKDKRIFLCKLKMRARYVPLVVIT